MAGFFTLVTYQRQPFLCQEASRRLLRRAIDACRARLPFRVHDLHAIWTLPDGDADFSARWAMIKKEFTRAWCAADGWEASVSESVRRNRRRGVWQRRFWEHLIRDATDLESHVNYVHYNPVKHRYVSCPHLWPWSSFHRWVERGAYRLDWSCACDGRLAKPPDFRGLRTGAMEDEHGE